MLDNEFYADGTGNTVSPKVLGVPNVTTGGGVYMAKLGQYMFSLETSAFQELTRSTEFRWPTQKRIGRAPAAQYTGQDDDTIELNGVIYPHFRGGLGQIERMRAMASKGKPLPLIFTFERLGQYNGLWCIKSIRETRKDFHANGAARKIEFTLSLVAYGEDFGGGKDAILAVQSAVSSLISQSVIKPPAGLGDLAVVVGTNDIAINAIDVWTPLQSVNDLHPIADTLSAVTTTARDIATKAVTTITGFVSGLPSEVLALIPPAALAAANDVLVVGTQLINAHDQVTQTFETLKSAAAPLKAAAKSFETDLATARRRYVQSGGGIKAASIALSSVEQSVGTLAKHRLSAAASLRHAANAADQLIYMANESARQVATLGALIDD